MHLRRNPLRPPRPCAGYVRCAALLALALFSALPAVSARVVTIGVIGSNDLGLRANIVSPTLYHLEKTLPQSSIVGLLLDAQKCIVEMLKQGARVDLGMLGAFYTTLTGRGAASPEEFTPDLVDRINVRWRPSKEMTTSLQHTPLKEVLNRAYQREVRRREKSQLNEAMEQAREND